MTRTQQESQIEIERSITAGVVTADFYRLIEALVAHLSSADVAVHRTGKMRRSRKRKREQQRAKPEATKQIGAGEYDHCAVNVKENFPVLALIHTLIVGICQKGGCSDVLAELQRMLNLSKR